MDKLKELLMMDPCYEQHIVSIKKVYEDSLFDILIPAIYEGFQSLYKRAYDVEKKFIDASKRNPDVENPGILIIFQTLIKEIPNLNTHKIRNETDRIKSSTKSADIFDDLVKAVCKANIILLTYNIDHKRHTLLKTKYHETVVIHDFIHTCYIQCAKRFYRQPELFYHNLDPASINSNKTICENLIKQSIEAAIRVMLPMKEILLEYVTQKYEQKENHFKNPYIHTGYPPGYPGYNAPGGGQRGHMHDMHDEYMDVNNILDRDLGHYSNKSLLEDEYEPENEETEDGNEFIQDTTEDSAKKNDFTLLLSDETETEKKTDKDTLLDDGKSDKSSKSSESAESEKSTRSDESEKIETEKVEKENKDVSSQDQGLRLVDISSALSKKGISQTYFKESLPEIQKRLAEYKNSKQQKSSPDEKGKTTDEKRKKQEDDGDDGIQITRSLSTESERPPKGKNAESEKKEGKTSKIDDILKA